MSDSDLPRVGPPPDGAMSKMNVESRITFPAPEEFEGPGAPSWRWNNGSPRSRWGGRLPRMLSGVQVGLDVGSRWVKYAVVRRHFSSVAVLDAGAVPITSAAGGELGKLRAQIEALKSVHEQINRPRARWIVGLGGTGTMIRTVEVPRMPRRELETAILWQAQKKFPFPLDDSHVAISYMRTPAKQPVRAVVAAALKRQVEDFLFLLSEAAIHPSALVLPAFGMAQAMLTTGPIAAGEYNGVINIGAERSLFAVYRGSNLEFYRELDVGTGDVEQALAEDTDVARKLDRMDTPQLSDMLFPRDRGGVHPLQEPSEPTDSSPVIHNALEKLVLEIQSTLEYYAAQSGGLRVNKFLLTGGGAGIAGIDQHLQELLDIPVRILEPGANGLLPADADDVARRAIWTGALGYALLSHRVPNLLPAEFIRRQEEQLRTMLWRSGTGVAVALALLLSGTEYYRADRVSDRLNLLETQIAETSAHLQQAEIRNLESTLAASRKWMAAVSRADLSASNFLRTVAALTPPEVAIDRIDVAPSDSGRVLASISGEVRTRHAQNEVVLADYVRRLEATGYLREVALASYHTARNQEYEQIFFNVTCQVPQETAR